MSNGSGLASLGFLQKLLQMGPTSPGQDPTAPASPQPNDGLSAALAPPAMPIQPQPSAQQPQQDGTQPPRDPNADLQDFQQQGQTKGHKLLQILQAGLVGGLSGMSANANSYAQTGRNAGFGGGVGAGFTQSLPFMKRLQGQELKKGGLENTLLQNQVQYDPLMKFIAMLKGGADYRKSEAEAGKFTAEAGKATAEAGAIPTRQALERAQTAAANYKESGGMLYDISGGMPKPVAGQTAPLDPDEAAILGKQPGEQVPMQIKNQANEMKNRGIRLAQAGGRSLVIDGKGNTIKDMGAATPVVTMNMQNPMAGSQFPVSTGQDALKGMTPQQQTLVKGIANYEIDPNDFMSKRNPAAGAQLIASVKQFDPSYDQTQYGTKSALRKSFTSGTDSQNIQALNTVAHHLSLLDQANDALNNGNTQLLNQVANAYKVKVSGQSAPVVFNAIKNAVSGELGNVFKKSGATDPEIASIGSTISDSLGKGITKNVIGADVGLVQGRLKALDFKYQQGMQKPADFRIISPEAEQIFNRLSAGGGSGGVQVTDPRGAVHTFPDQASASAFKKAAGIQ